MRLKIADSWGLADQPASHPTSVLCCSIMYSLGQAAGTAVHCPGTNQSLGYRCRRPVR